MTDVTIVTTVTASQPFTASGGGRIVNDTRVTRRESSMPASSSSNTQPGNSASENSALKCRTCGRSFAPPAGDEREASAAIVEGESARCSRLREITQQRQSLAARIQAGFAGVLGTEAVDTVDRVVQRQSLGQLDATLKAEAEELSKVMRHVPIGP